MSEKVNEKIYRIKNLINHIDFLMERYTWEECKESVVALVGRIREVVGVC